MSTYIADKYAGLLTEEDVNVLFNRLAKEFGDNRSEAARQCGLTGKATYDWEDAAYVKLGTKKKVLEASLKKNFLNTMEYLLSKSNNRNIDLLQMILSTLYANALEATSSEDFKTNFTKFELIRMRNLGIIREGMQTEVSDMSTMLKDKATEFRIPVAPRSVNEFSAEEIINVVQLVGRVYSENPTQAQSMAENDIGLPANALKPLIQTFNDLCFARKIRATATDEPEMKSKPLIASQLEATHKMQWIDVHGRYLTPDDTWYKPLVDRYAEGGPLHEITTRA